MPTTARGYRYPASTDQPRVWEDMLDLASDVDADVTAALRVRVCKLAGQVNQSIPDNVDTVVSFGSGSEEIKTDAGWHSNTVNPTRVTVDVAGFVEVTAQAAITFSSTLEHADVAVRKNGTASWRSGNVTPTQTNNVNRHVGSLTETIACAPGDYFEMSVLQNSTGNAAQTLNTGGAGTRLTVRYLGPA